MEIASEFWTGKNVFVTGHTGFKGGWLVFWLSKLGANVTGYALDPPTSPSLFDDANVSAHLSADIRADIRDRAALANAMRSTRPDIVFHMAAQSLVSKGYSDPIETYEVNVMGTANVLVSSFECSSVQTIISVASDKCYDNREWVHPYRETDRLGGTDPYSSSKGCAEILTSSFRDSLNPTARLASVRAGNVIGGGDWAENRLVPDCIRAFSADEPVVLRRPESIRPWQLVLEPLSGYLLLAQALSLADDRNLEGGWNFGPVAGGEVATLEIAERLASIWGEGSDVQIDRTAGDFNEANLLRLDSTKARVALGWRPLLSIGQCIDWTAQWYDAGRRQEDLEAVTAGQIQSYMNLM